MVFILRTKSLTKNPVIKFQDDILDTFLTNENSRKIDTYWQHYIPGENGVNNDIYTAIDESPDSNPGSYASYPF